MKKLTIPELEVELRNIIADKKSKNPQYSARAFAKSLGFSDSLIYKVINSERHLSKRSAKEICKILGYELVDSHKITTSQSKKHNHLKSLNLEISDFSDDEFSSSRSKIISFIESIQAHCKITNFQSMTKLIIEIRALTKEAF